MIINFSIENWMSFKNNITFSMVGSQEKQHKERVPFLKKYNIKILPISAIYGGNASGKTNLFMAINFIKNFVVKGTLPGSPITVKPFLLNSESPHKATVFSLDILIENQIYNFSFSVTHKRVIEEKLVLLNVSSEKILYHRKNEKPNFHPSIKNQDFLNFAFKGTRENMLFLTNSVSQNIDTFKPVYKWFSECLELIAPDSRFEAFEQFFDGNNKLYEIMNNTLPLLDTGISRICAEEIPIDELNKDLRIQLENELMDGMTVRILSGAFGVTSADRLLVTRREDKLIAKKLVTIHIKDNSEEIKFELNQESDGSKRIVDLLPAFFGFACLNSNKIFIIDEVDRSLHTTLTRKLLELYLSSCSNNSRSQIVFTAHDVQLIDQSLLRRDELWVTEKDINGVSVLSSLSLFKDIRKDKDIQKSYLEGRFGGVPCLTLTIDTPLFNKTA